MRTFQQVIDDATREINNCDGITYGPDFFNARMIKILAHQVSQLELELDAIRSSLDRVETALKNQEHA